MTNRWFDSKIKKLEEMRLISTELKKSGKKIVHCHGVFDLLHPGHIRHLNSAKEYGDILVVTITADRYVRKGPGRPAFNQKLRADSLANIAVIDFVCILDHPTAIEGIIGIKPNYYVKGPDYKNMDEDITAKIFDEQDTVESVGGQIVFTEDITFSSSKLINQYLDSYPAKTLEYLKTLSKKYDVTDIVNRLKTIENLKILVVGDTIIDQYYYCSPLGKSAKESLVAHKYLSSEDFAGGCLATANHVAQLTRNVELLTLLGEKNSFEDFITTHLNPYVKLRAFRRPECVTTVKRRYVNVDGNRKLFEVCYIDDHPLGEDDENKIAQYLEENLPKFDLVIVSDFGHGLMTHRLMEIFCTKAKLLALNVQTNSANLGFNLVTKYSRADFICIDERELRLATQDRYSAPFSLLERVYHQLHCQQMVSTRGSLGSVAYNQQNGFHEAVAVAYQSIDTIGAGDAFYAYGAACFAIGMEQDLLSFIGNAAGALKVQIIGNREPVKFVDLAKFLQRLMKL